MPAGNLTSGRRGARIFANASASSPNWLGRSVLWAAAGLVGLALLIPLAYLLLRGLEHPADALETLLRWRTAQILVDTLALAGGVTLASILIAMPVAWLTTRTDLPGRRGWALLTPLPLVIPSYVGAYLLISALGPRGLLQGWLEDWLGIERLPDIYGYPGALLALTLMSYPYVLLSVRAAWQRLDPALEEAARSLGRTPWQVFWEVTLPQLRPALGAGALLVALYVLRDFGAVALMRYNTFTRVIFTQYQSFDRGQAALLALALVALTLGFLALEGLARSRGRYYRVDASTSKPAPVTALGIWRIPALVWCGLVVGMALVLPAAVLLYWLWRSLETPAALGELLNPAGGSLLGAALAAVFTVLAALPVAVVSVRYRGWLARLPERITHLAYALPGLVVALALVFFGTRLALPLYQTLPMLVLGYVIIFISQPTGILRAALLSINPSLEEAARSLGYTAAQSFARINLPLIRPALSGAAILTFLTAIKELPLTLILAPIGFKTLAIAVWSAVSEAFFARAALPALLIILVSSVPLAILSIRESSETP